MRGWHFYTIVAFGFLVFAKESRANDPTWIDGIDFARHDIVIYSSEWTIPATFGGKDDDPYEDRIFKRGVTNGSIKDVKDFFDAAMKRGCILAKEESDRRAVPCYGAGTLFVAGAMFAFDTTKNSYRQVKAATSGVWKLQKNAYCDGVTVFAGKIANGLWSGDWTTSAVSSPGDQVISDDAVVCLGMATQSTEIWMLNQILEETRKTNNTLSAWNLTDAIDKFIATMTMLAGRCPTDPSKTIDPSTGACMDKAN